MTVTTHTAPTIPDDRAISPAEAYARSAEWQEFEDKKLDEERRIILARIRADLYTDANTDHGATAKYMDADVFVTGFRAIDAVVDDVAHEYLDQGWAVAMHGHSGFTLATVEQAQTKLASFTEEFDEYQRRRRNGIAFWLALFALALLVFSLLRDWTLVALLVAVGVLFVSVVAALDISFWNPPEQPPNYQWTDRDESAPLPSRKDRS